jgi:hypothetical protein
MGGRRATCFGRASAVNALAVVESSAQFQSRGLHHHRCVPDGVDGVLWCISPEKAGSILKL